MVADLLSYKVRESLKFSGFFDHEIRKIHERKSMGKWFSPNND